MYDAIEGLEAEEIALLTGMEKLSALMDWFNGQVMALEGENNFTVMTEADLRAAVATNGAVITLGNDIALSSEFWINYDKPTQNFKTTIITNDYRLTGTIKLNGCTLTVDGTLDANVEAYKRKALICGAVLHIFMVALIREISTWIIQLLNPVHMKVELTEMSY